MKRTISWLLATLAVLTIAEPDRAHAETDAVPDSSWARIGEIHSDTLYVARDKIIALALEQNEMLAASGAMRDAAGADATAALRAFLPQVQLGSFFLRSDDALNSFGYKLQNRAVTPQDFNPINLNNPGETNQFISHIQDLRWGSGSHAGVDCRSIRVQAVEPLRLLCRYVPGYRSNEVVVVGLPAEWAVLGHVAQQVEISFQQVQSMHHWA